MNRFDEHGPLPKMLWRAGQTLGLREDLF